MKVIGDFARWNDELVFGCDDSAQKEFLNKRKAKGNIEGPGQSNSNLWFTSLTKPDELGPATVRWSNLGKRRCASKCLFRSICLPVGNNVVAKLQNDGKQDITFTLR